MGAAGTTAHALFKHTHSPYPVNTEAQQLMKLALGVTCKSTMIRGVGCLPPTLSRSFVPTCVAPSMVWMNY